MLEIIPLTILTFVICWVVMFFILLPIGVKIPEQTKEGHADSAPENAGMMWKIIASIIISGILTAIYIWYIYKI